MDPGSSVLFISNSHLTPNTKYTLLIVFCVFAVGKLNVLLQIHSVQIPVKCSVSYEVP